MGLGKMVSKKKDSIGMVLSQREGLNDPDGYRLVGVRPVDPKGKLTAGSHFLEKGAAAVMANDGGWLTSKVYSPHVGSDIALGYPDAGGEPLGGHGDRGRDRQSPVRRSGRGAGAWVTCRR